MHSNVLVKMDDEINDQLTPLEKLAVEACVEVFEEKSPSCEYRRSGECSLTLNSCEVRGCPRLSEKRKLIPSDEGVEKVEGAEKDGEPVS